MAGRNLWEPCHNHVTFMLDRCRKFNCQRIVKRLAAETCMLF